MLRQLQKFKLLNVDDGYLDYAITDFIAVGNRNTRVGKFPTSLKNINYTATQ